MLTNVIDGVLPAPISLDARYSKRMANRCALLFACALFGYPVIGSVISLLQIDSRSLSVPFRIAVALFSVYVILTSRRLKIDRLRQVMLLIWFLYIIRLLHDLLIPNLEGSDYALQFFIVSSVLPGLALMKSQVYEWRRFALIAFVVAGAGALIGMFGAIIGGADVQEGAVAGRLSLTAVNPVSLGNEATSAILCGLVMWRGATIRYRLVLACIFGLIFLCLLLTGSKGPVLQLILCVGLWALSRGRALRMALVALPLLVWVTVSTENPLSARLEQSSDDTSTLDRVSMINDSLDQIAGSPLIGSAFVELNSGFYPHNVFVEAGLAFGVPIALVFTGLMFVGAYRAWKALKTDYDLLGLLFFQGLLDAAIAGSLYGMTLLWVILAMLPAAAMVARNPMRKLQRVAVVPASLG
jgi:O-antigen ligase